MNVKKKRSLYKPLYERLQQVWINCPAQSRICDQWIAPPLGLNNQIYVSFGHYDFHKVKIMQLFAELALRALILIAVGHPHL